MADPATTTLADATPSDWTTPGFLAETTSAPAPQSLTLIDVAPSMRATPTIRDTPKEEPEAKNTNFFDRFDSPTSATLASAPSRNFFDQFDITSDATAAVQHASDVTPPDRNFFDQFDRVEPIQKQAMPGWAGASMNFDDAAARTLSSMSTGAGRWLGDNLADAPHWAGNLLAAFDGSVNDPNGPENPYLALASRYGTALSGVAKGFQGYANTVLPEDPNRPVTSTAGGLVGGIVPTVGATLLTGPIGGAVVGGGTFGAQNYAQARDQGADLFGGNFAGGAGMVLGGVLPSSNILRTAEPLVGRTWGQLAYGTLLNSSKAYWEGAGINLGTGEAVNAVSAPDQQQSQSQLWWNSLESALPFAFFGAGAHAVEQGKAEAAVSDAARQAGMDKAQFITSTARYMDATANSQVLSPEQKMQAVTGFLAPFSPSAQQAIVAHVQNVGTAMESIRAAADQAKALTPTNPLTAEALQKEQTDAAVEKMQTTATSIDQEADEAEKRAQVAFPEAKESAETKAANPETKPAESETPIAQNETVQINRETALPPEEQPIIQSPIPGGMISDEYAALARHMENSPDPDIQVRARELLQLRQQALQEHAATDSTARKAELENEILAHEAALRSLSEEPQRETPPVPTPAEVQTSAPSPAVIDYDGYGRPIYAETPSPAPEKSDETQPTAEPVPVAESVRTEQQGQPAVESAPPMAEQHPAETAPAVEEKPPLPALDGLKRPALEKLALEEGHHPDDIKAAKTAKDVREMIEAKRAVGEKETARGELADDGKAQVDPKIKSLPAKYRKPVEAFIKAAKVGKMWGVTKFVLSTDHPSKAPLWADPRRGSFDTVYIDPLELHKIGADAAFNRKAFQEERLHNQAGYVLNKRWEAAGKPGTFEEFYDKNFQAVHDQMTKTQRDKLQETYGVIGMHPVNIGEEFFRQTMQKAMGENLTEDEYNELAKRLRNNRPLRNIVQAVKERLTAMVQKLTGHGIKDDELNLAERKLDELMSGKKPEPSAEEAKGESTAPGLPAPKEEPDESDLWLSGDEGVRTAPIITPMKSPKQIAEYKPFVEEGEAAGELKPTGAEQLRSQRTIPTEAQERERAIANRIRSLEHIDIPADRQQEFRQRASDLARLHFSNEAVRDLAESNAFVKVMIEAKKWQEKNGSLEGFGSRRIIQNSLLDDGRRLSRGQSIATPAEEPEPSMEGENAPQPKGYDASAQEYEEQQQQFEPVGREGADLATTETPAKRAQDALVNRNMQEITNRISPYGRRLLEIWADTPHDPSAAFAPWVSRAAKEFGLPRAKIMADFDALTSGLRKEINRRGLTREDFIRMPGLPRREEETRQNISSGYGAEHGNPEEERTPGEHVADGNQPGHGQEPGTGGENDSRSETRASTPERFRSAYLDDYGKQLASGSRKEGPAALLSFAERNGLVLKPEQVEKVADEHIGSGIEHDVFLPGDGRQAYKITKGKTAFGQSGPDELDYLNQFEKLNQLNPKLDTRILGVVQRRNWPAVVSRQNYLAGDHPPEAWIEKYMAAHGFEPMPGYQYRYAHPSGLELSDVHSKNVIRDEDGNMLPFDIKIYGDVPAPLTEMKGPAAPGLPPRQESFAKRGSQDERLKENLRSVLASRVYEQKANQITNDEANAFLAQHGDDAAYGMVLERLKTGRPTATDNAVAQKLILKLDSTPPEDGASHLKAAELATAASTAGKEFGQFTQAFRMWSKLGANGVLQAYDKIIRPAIEGAKGPFKNVTDAIEGAIRVGRQQAVDETLDRLDKSGLTGKADRAAAIVQEENKPIWQRYMEATSNALSKLRTEASSPKVQGALEEFAGRLKTNLTGLMREMLSKAKGQTPEKLSATTKLGEVYKNMPEYQQAWDHARDFIQLKYKDDPETLQRFEMAMNRVFEAPVKLTDKALDEQMKASGISLRDVAKQWAESQNATRDSLIKQIVDKMGLTPEQAKAAGEAIAARFQERLEVAKKNEVARLLKQSGQNRLANAAPDIADKIFKAINLGAADNDVIWNTIAEKYGLPRYDKAVAQDLARRANEIQKMIAAGKEGKITDDKTQDMMNILANEAQKRMSYLRQIGEGEMAIFYGNIFGPSTIGRKSISEVLNLVSEVGTMAAVQMRHGDLFALPRAYAAAMRGLYQRGGADFRSIMATGRGMRQLSGDYTADNLVERGKIFGNVPVLSKLNTPLSLLYKPVGRALYGAQAFFYSGAAEARANMIAYRAAKQLIREGKAPAEATVNRLTQEILGNSPEMRQGFLEQAVEEGLTGRAAVLRAQELAEQSRPEEIRQAAHDFASRATFMQEPEGVLGVVYRGVAQMTRTFPPLRLLVPVTRVVSNVFNNFLSYTPAGIGLPKFGSFDGSGAIKLAQEGKSDEMYQQIAKMTAGALGTIGMVSLFGQNIQGAGPQDYSKRKQLMDEGWIPFSVKVGNSYYSYREWPVALMMAGAGSYMDQMKYGGGQKDALSRVALAFQASGRFALTSSWISSVNGLLDAFSTTNAESGWQSFLRTMGSTAGALVPFNQSTLKVIDKIFDPQLYPPNSVQGALMSQVVVARRFDNGNAPMLNALGDPVESNPIQAFYSSTNPDPVWNALAEKNIFIPMATKAEKVNGRPITNEEFYALMRDAGQATKQTLLNSGMEAMAEMDQEQAQHYLSAVYRRNIDTVKAQIAASAVDAGQGATPVGRSRKR